MQLGDILTVKKFSFSNKAGGTGLSDWKWNEKFDKPIKVEVIKVLNDYETGQQAWVISHPDEKELIAYLDRNARKGLPFFNRDTDELTFDASDVYVLFVSEFNIIDTPKSIYKAADLTAQAVLIKAIVITGKSPSEFAYTLIKSGIGSDDQPNYLNIYEDASEDLTITRMSKEEVLSEFAISEEMLVSLEGEVR